MAEEQTLHLKSSGPLWRLQLVRTLQILGLLVGVVGGAEFMGIVKALSPEIAAWLALSGTALRFGAEPLILLLGDLLDDGIQNNSFTIPKKVGLFLMLCCLGALTCFSVSCAGSGVSLGITPEGCAMFTYGHGSKTYSAGPCIGPDGKIDRYRSEWRNTDGVALRAERVTKTKVTTVWYQSTDGTWLKWSSKSGVMLGPVPNEVTPALDVPVVIPAK